MTQRDSLIRRPGSPDGYGWLRYIDNPANEDRWSDAKGIADRARHPRRGMTPILEKLQREGWIESMREDYVPSPRSDPPPRLWRVKMKAPVEDGTCSCGHAAEEHMLLDHDANAPLGYTKWRQEQRLARWHWICKADTHPDGEADSPWDHVCGCLHNIYDHEGHPTINPESEPVKKLLREAMKEYAPA